MLKTLRQLFVRPTSDLADILSTESSREELLGMKFAAQPTSEQILADANKLMDYAASAAYRVWAKEAWAKAISHMDAIQNSKASSDEVNFHRGALKATLDLLRVSYQARSSKESLEAQDGVSSAR